MVRNCAYLSLYMPSSLDEKQCRCRLPVCRSPRSLFGHWSPDLRSWDFWKFGRQLSPTKPYPTYPSMYIDRTHSLRYRWCIILKYQELSWVYITNCWMLFLSNELCSTGSMLLWRYVHSCRIWDFFSLHWTFCLAMRAPLKNTFHQSLGRHGHVRGWFWRQCGALGFDNGGLEWVCRKGRRWKSHWRVGYPNNRTQHLLRSSLSWRTCHGGQWQMASANAFTIKPGKQHWK